MGAIELTKEEAELIFNLLDVPMQGRELKRVAVGLEDKLLAAGFMPPARPITNPKRV